MEMWIWRRTQKINLTEHVTNEEVLKWVGEEKSLADSIYRKQEQWLGHILRHRRLLRDVMEGR